VSEENDPPGTWTIIHSDGTTTTVKTELMGSGKTDPEVMSDGDTPDSILAFGYQDGTVRVFPFHTIFEINFKPEKLNGDDDNE
jgi:hypothetical protein